MVQQKRVVKGIADVTDIATGGLLKTWNDSNAASNRELARNFPGSTSPPVQSKESSMADAGLTIAKPRGISTVAGNNSTPFVPAFQDSRTTLPATPTANNVWTDTLKQAGQPLAPLPAITKATIPAPDKIGSGDLSRLADGSLPSVMRTPPPAAAVADKGAPVFASGSGTMIGNPLKYQTPQKTIAGITSPINDWSPGSANVRQLGIADVYNQQVADATRINALDKEQKLNRSAAERFSELSSGNQTWSLPKEERMALAVGSYNADRKGIADTLASDTTRQGQELALKGNKYTADQQLAGKNLDSIAHVKAAELTAGGREKASTAEHQNDKLKLDQKAQEEEEKRVVSVLTGNKIAPSIEAIKRYKQYEKSQAEWDGKATKYFGALQKTQPDLTRTLVPLLDMYHKNPDPKTREDIKKQISVLKGPEDIINHLLTPPAFNSNGLMPYKQDNQLIAGV